MLPLKFIATLISLAFSSSAMAGFIPSHLAEMDSYVRVVVVKKYIELSKASGDRISYRNLTSDIGKYSSSVGDFSFSGEIWISNQRKFQCVTYFVPAHFDQGLKRFTIDEQLLSSNSECIEVPPTE